MTKDLTPYKVLAFQYKPIEKIMREVVTPEQWEQYQACDDHRKVFILDEMAKEMGL